MAETEPSSNPTGIDCPIRTALLRAFLEATRAYTGTVLALKPSTAERADRDTMLRKAEEAEAKAVVARQELRNHIVDHGC